MAQQIHTIKGKHNIVAIDLMFCRNFEAVCDNCLKGGQIGKAKWPDNQYRLVFSLLSLDTLVSVVPNG